MHKIYPFQIYPFQYVLPPPLGSEQILLSLQEARRRICSHTCRSQSRIVIHILHGVHSDFNSIVIQVIRDLDFQYWANLRISSNPSFQCGMFTTSKWRMFSAWSSTSKSSEIHVKHCHEILSRWILSHLNQHLRHLYSLECPLEDFRIFCYDFATISLYGNFGRRWIRQDWHVTGWDSSFRAVIKVFAPLRYFSGDTEVVDGTDCAKQLLCCRRITVVVNR